MNRVPKLALDATEERVRQTLVTFADVYSREIGRKITLRITGGWVRDKLLNRPSHDIDIAIDVTTGEQFAVALQKYLAGEGKSASSVHTIARNPEKSKHLETATTKLFNLDIDFVNLRSEQYTGASRIPQIDFGTPKEDAMRRDATLNALFYNLELNQVEDFTERGLQDLNDGILRTPLDPFETFKDDPLRVLRLIRFSGQLNFTLAEDVEKSMESQEIKIELQRKVSRERVGIELSKLVDAKYAITGLRYFVRLGLTSTVFDIPPGYTGPQANYDDVSDRLELAYSTLPHVKFYNGDNHGDLWLAVILTSWGNLSFLNAKGKPEAAAHTLIKEGIKLSKSRAALVTKLVDCADEIYQLASKTDRVSTGHVVRLGREDWRTCLAFTACKYNDVEKLTTLHNRIIEYGLADAYLLKPIITGSDIMKMYPGRRAGAWLTQSVKKVIDFQLETPDISIEEAQARISAYIDTNYSSEL